jgi:uncharacterized protein (DUF433 family)
LIVLLNILKFLFNTQATQGDTLTKNKYEVKTMTLTTTEYKHIQINEHNVPIIAGTTMKVVELITSVKAYGWSPEELHINYPHLTMSQIHSALAYYWDHQEELDTDIERRFQYVENLRQQSGEYPLAQKLRAKGLIQ